MNMHVYNTYMNWISENGNIMKFIMDRDIIKFKLSGHEMNDKQCAKWCMYYTKVFTVSICICYFIMIIINECQFDVFLELVSSDGSAYYLRPFVPCFLELIQG